MISNGYMRSVIAMITLAWGISARAEVVIPKMPVGVVVKSDRSLLDLQGCVTRAVARAGAATAIPLSDGVAIDLQMRDLFSTHQPSLTFQVRDLGDHRELSLFYREPWTANRALMMLRAAVKQCAPENADQIPKKI